MSTLDCAVVIPTTGRENLAGLLEMLAKDSDAGPREVVLVDDRPVPEPPISPPSQAVPIRVLRSGGRGPAGARNVGWSAARTEWVAFLDDDVRPDPEWTERLRFDLEHADPDVGASQAKIIVPLDADRAPTDWQRCTASLADAWWITADMAYRRAALVDAGGFDERFPRAYREDADLALRVTELGWRITQGSRSTTHPVRPEGPWVSLRTQRGNADNALMRRKHGRHWRGRIGEGPGRLRLHAMTTASGSLALIGTLRIAGARVGIRRWERNRLMTRATTIAAGISWLALTADFAWRRIAPGPRTRREIAAMLATSAAIPPAACLHRLRGELIAQRHRPRTPLVVLFDRDGTLIHDVPYNGDAELVRPVDGIGETLDRLRDNGILLGIISNQSGVARGFIEPEQVRAVNAEVERRLGPIAAWEVCPHSESDGCRCRKPAPGMVHRAAASLGVPAADCLVVGDTGADVEAALAAGANAALVPNGRTRPAEIRRARRRATVARTVVQAVRAAVPDRSGGGG